MNSNFRYKILISCFFLLTISVVVVSCSGKNEKTSNEEINNDSIAKNSGAVVNVKGKLFGIPSPFQTSILIQKLAIPYDNSILNPTNSINKYKSDFQKAFNLGVFGADLGYVVLFEKHQESVAYLTAAKKLGDDLGISSAFDQKVMDRIFKNISNKDSVLVLSSLAYRSGNLFLKSNEYENVASLIMTGSWFEGLYIVLKSNETKNNEDLRNRIAEQKQTLNNIIDLLSPYKNEKAYADLINNLTELQKVYQGINIKYEYVKPETNAQNNTTIINSKTTVEISDDQIKELLKIISKIRSTYCSTF